MLGWLYCLLICVVNVGGQSSNDGLTVGGAVRDARLDSGFRIEKLAVAGGAELITIFGKHDLQQSVQGPVSEIPLVSILRDTLGDDVPENDRLRYVWMLTFTRPSASQKISAVVPFLYNRTSNKGDVGTDPPPSIIDVQSPSKVVWNKVFWLLFKKLILGEFSISMRASASQFRQNAADYRRSAVVAAMAVLSMYHAVEGDVVLSETELRDLQARLSLTDKTFGWHMQNENLGRTFEKDITKTRDFRGHNWELLRQYSEAQGLFFEPLEMPDGSARHAIVWAATSDIERNKGRKFDGRFLNIKNPWNDPKLLDWNGYSQVRWYDADDREVEPETPNARPRTLIPLAIYGLDHPKIPVLLVDFRDNSNAKRRELSKRVLDDLTGGVLSLSKFGGLPYLFGRFIFDFVVKRRGLDLNYESRLRSYSQLKLLLSLEASLEPEFRDEIARRIESATVNPLQNDVDVETRLAHTQYKNLVDYAMRPDGLPKKIYNDRRQEMARLKHGTADRAFFAAARFISFGAFTHREKETPALLAQMNIRRQLDYHERFLREVAHASAKPEIDTDMTKLKRSLTFVSINGVDAEEKTTRALARIFEITDDQDVQSLCVTSLYRINNASAKQELLAIYSHETIAGRWRDICAHYLKLALEERQRISARDAQTISNITAN
ncbi:MAG: hypothetical protein ABR530_06685 [Pyrinomonadaceae bacterium]